MDKNTAITLARRYADAVNKTLAPEQILIFGSYINGAPTEDSDIDIAVICRDFTGDWLKTSAHLWGLTWDVSTLIEPILLDSANDDSGFVAEVLKTGLVIYQRPAPAVA